MHMQIKNYLKHWIGFYSKLEKWNNDIGNEKLLDECQKYAIVVARDINRILIKYKNNRSIHTR